MFKNFLKNVGENSKNICFALHFSCHMCSFGPINKFSFKLGQFLQCFARKKLKKLLNSLSKALLFYFYRALFNQFFFCSITIIAKIQPLKDFN